ncbi:MAG: methyltransferase domain-containing protein [Acidimicrobiales bacterium]|nr:methyltransferase domain-containing protein [Acidimicrobiales bacterium]MCB9396008.1 methyltransferase domain-containing protein [Acidimicrobiaceae bacterium]
MSGRRPTERDTRRRELGQNFLVDQRVVSRFISSLDLHPDELVLDLGAGTGALTLRLLDAGVDVWAVECDPAWLDVLRRNVANHARHRSARIVPADLRRLRLPRLPYRVVANPPFGSTTELLAAFLDDPDRGPGRLDLILQREVAAKHSRQPPQSLRTAAWAPWWEFRLGDTIERRAFRPQPRVDAAVLTITRREPAILPSRLSPRLRELLRPAWSE